MYHWLKRHAWLIVRIATVLGTAFGVLASWPGQKTGVDAPDQLDREELPAEEDYRSEAKEQYNISQVQVSWCPQFQVRRVSTQRVPAKQPYLAEHGASI